jgi:hypothetical protein
MSMKVNPARLSQSIALPLQVVLPHNHQRSGVAEPFFIMLQKVSAILCDVHAGSKICNVAATNNQMNFQKILIQLFLSYSIKVVS